MKKYHVALNIKPDSIGWVALDDRFKVIKAHPNHHKNFQKMMGVAKFPIGKSAEETRVIRNTRRRLARRKKRISWLNDFFAPYLAAVDDMFLMRLKYSNLAGNDKKFSGDEIFDDKEKAREFHQKYPTIYHLRNALMTENQKFDLRLIYLAMHSIVKYRGHFNSDAPISQIDSVNYSEILKDIQQKFNDTELSGLVKLIPDGDMMRKVLLDSQLGLREQKKQLQETLLADTDSKAAQKINKQVLGEFSKGITGSKISVDKLFQLDSELGITFSLADEDADEVLDSISGNLSNEESDILQLIKNIYLAISLEKIVPNGKTFSQTQVELYNRYHDQYKTLVAFRKQLTTVKENQAIHEAVDRYGNNKYQKKGKVDREGFYTLLKPYLKKYADLPEAKQIQQWIDDDDFMVKPRNKRNILIPRQLHQYEMDRIIENQSKYYPFLAEPNPREERRREAPYKFDELLAFRLPYYVGPLVDNNNVPDASVSKNAWVDFKNDQHGDITPYNFPDKIDAEKTANRFIRRLTAHDGVILSEDVLPSSAVLYQRFNVLNELNKVKVDDKLLRPGDKQKIFNDLFRVHKTVTVAKLKNYLRANYGYTHDPEITGLSNSKSFDSTYSTYIDFKRIIGDKVDNPDYQEDIDKMVEWSTIFPKGPIYRHKLSEIDWLDDIQRNKIANLHYSGWGRYSRLTLAGIVNSNGERVIDVMWNTNLNFNQVINQPEFKQLVANENEAYINDRESFNEILNSTYTSPKNRKAIRQAMYVLNDIVKKMKHDPETVSIRFLCESQESGQSKTRQKQLQAVYRKITKDISNNYFSDKLVLTKELKKQSKLNDRLYLYFLQFGRDMYTGMKINIDDLISHPNNYQIAHILPTSFIRDNSLNNKVLIKRSNRAINMRLIRTSQMSFWNTLQKMGLLTQSKFRNLLADTNYIGRFAREGLVRRQLTANSQIIKLTATFINNQFKQTKVIEVKNNLLEQLKDKFELNSRIQINDYQSATEAYLTDVIGIYLLKTYPRLEFFFRYGAHPYNLKYLKELKTFNFLYHLLRDNDDFVIPETGGLSVSDLAKLIKKTAHSPFVTVTNQPITNHGALFKQTIFPHQEYSPKFLNIKKNKDAKVYGGYKNAIGAYLSLIRVDMPDKTHYYRLITVPRLVSDQLDQLIATNKSAARKLILDLAEQQVSKKEQEANLSVELLKVFYHQTAIIDEHPIVISSAVQIWSAEQLILSPESIKALNSAIQNDQDEEGLSTKLLTVYDELIKQISQYMYLYNEAGIAEKLESTRDKFIKMPNTTATAVKNTKSNKLYVLSELIRALQAGPSRTSLKTLLGVPGMMGFFSKAPILHSGDKLIITSPTGFNNKEYTLQ